VGNDVGGNIQMRWNVTHRTQSQPKDNAALGAKATVLSTRFGERVKSTKYKKKGER